MFKIEKNVPMPKNWMNSFERHRDRKYPFKEMEVGDSFLANGIKEKTVKSIAYAEGHRLGKKFACRTVDGVVRVWRIQ